MTNPNSTPIGELHYLEHIVDFEDEIDRGAIAEKEIIIYSPGKTGTTSIFHSIGTYCARAYSRESYEKWMLHNHNNTALLKNIKPTSQDVSESHLNKRLIIKDLVEYKRRLDKKLLIISSYREPISRLISNTFNVINNHLFISKTHKMEDYDYASCLKLLRDQLDIKETQHPIEEIEPDFFDREVFDKENKFLFVDRGHYKILLLCLEHSDKWQHALSSQLGFDGINILRVNQASDKDISAMYKEFKERLSLPYSLIRDIYYEGPFAKYLEWFYTKREIDDFFQRALTSYSDSTHCPAGTNEIKLQQNQLYSDDSTGSTSADAELLCSSWSFNDNQYSITVKLTNTGNTIWLSGRPRKGTIALALRSKNTLNKIHTSNWCRLMEDVAPGQDVVMEAKMKIPDGLAELDWKLDMVIMDITWIPLSVPVPKKANHSDSDTSSTQNPS